MMDCQVKPGNDNRDSKWPETALEAGAGQIRRLVIEAKECRQFGALPLPEGDKNAVGSG
jgi:hypothetical protein